jgi:hypothetical protein
MKVQALIPHLEKRDVVVVHIRIVQLMWYDLCHPIYSSTLVVFVRTSPQVQVRRLQEYSLVQLAAVTGNYISVLGQTRDITTMNFGQLHFHQNSH